MNSLISKMLMSAAFLAAITAPKAFAEESVKCDIDQDGEYCVIDLISHCTDHTACSVTWGSHSIWSISTTGLMKMQPGEGQVNEHIDKGDKLPANNMVCSDLPITRVYYQPMNASVRWTSDSNGYIRDPQQNISGPPIYPGVGKSLKSTCVRMDAGADGVAEPKYSILSVRVAASLDKDRAKELKDLMVRAGTRLVEDLKAQRAIAKDYQDKYKTVGKDGKLLYPAIAESMPVLDGYIHSLDSALTNFDGLKWAFWSKQERETRKPVTTPEITNALRSSYVYGKLLIASLSKTELGTAGFIAQLNNFCAEVNQGFGFNDFDTTTAINATSVGGVKITPALAAQILDKGNHASQLIPAYARYAGRLRDFSAMLLDLSNTVKTLKADPTVPDTYMMTGDADQKANGAYQACSALVKAFPSKSYLYDTYRDEIHSFCGELKVSFNISDTPQVSTVSKVAPLFDILTLAMSETTGSLNLLWSDPRFHAAEDARAQISDLAPVARQNGDQAIDGNIADIAAIWQSPAFSDLLKEVQAKADAGSDSAKAIRNSLSDAYRMMRSVSPKTADAIVPPKGFL